MKKTILIILTFYIGISTVFADNKFDSLLSLGKHYYKLYDTNNTEDYIYRLVNLKKAKEYLKLALLADSINSEANYFMGYTADAEFYGISPGDSIQNSTLRKVNEISNYFERIISKKELYSKESLILSPHSKLSSLYGSLALAYLYKNDYDSAKIAFRLGKEKGGFTDLSLSFGKNMLLDCDSNSILFTWGDMDTFPLLYLQLIENLRTDVTIINAGLLGTKWYTNLIFKKYLSKKVILIYSENELDSIYNSLPKEIQLTNNQIEVSTSDLEKYNVKDYSVKSSLIFSWIYYGQKFGSTNFMTFSDAILLEIFKANHWKNKIYFAVTVNPSILYCFGWIQNVKQKGLLYELTPDTYYNDEQVDYEFLASRIIGSKKWDLSKINEKYSLFDSDSKIYNSNFQQTYLLLAYYYYQVKKDVKKTKIVLDEFEKTLPWEMVPLDKRDINYWVDLYRFINEPEKANYIQSEFFDK